MEKYDKNRPCQKCGEKGASSEYVPITISSLIPINIPLSKSMIERKCHNCGFTWHESPLDAPENSNSMAGQNEKSNNA